MKVRLCARPNVQEFLCPVWEIAILIGGRVNMNSAVEQTSLHSTRRAIERALWSPNRRKTLRNEIARSNSPWKSCLLSHGSSRTRRVGEKHTCKAEQQYCATNNSCNVTISNVNHLSSKRRNLYYVLSSNVYD